jgi:hypothetical protein
MWDFIDALVFTAPLWVLLIVILILKGIFT